MIVIAIIGLLAVLATPTALRARNRANTQLCLENLRQISAAKELFAFETNAAPGFEPAISDLQPHVRSVNTFVCPASREPLLIGETGTEPRCAFHGHQAGRAEPPDADD